MGMLDFMRRLGWSQKSPRLLVIYRVKHKLRKFPIFSYKDSRILHELSPPETDNDKKEIIDHICRHHGLTPDCIEILETHALFPLDEEIRQRKVEIVRIHAQDAEWLLQKAREEYEEFRRRYESGDRRYDIQQRAERIAEALGYRMGMRSNDDRNYEIWCSPWEVDVPADKRAPSM